MKKQLLSIFLCFIMIFPVSYAYCTDIPQMPFEANGMNIIEAMEAFNNLFEQFKNTKNTDEKKAIFAEAKALNDAFFGGSDTTFNGYTEMLVEIERIEAVENTLEHIAAKLLTYNHVPSTVFGGLIVGGVEQKPEKRILTDEERLEVINLLEKALEPGCIEKSGSTEKSYFLRAANSVYAVRGEGELGKRIEELYLKITNHPLLKSDEDIIKDTELTFSDVSESDWFFEYVMVMAGRGFVNGKTVPVNGVGTFFPNDTITRGEFIAVVIRILYPENNYTSAEGAPWWKASYDVAIQNSLILKDDKAKSGDIPITRQEMASIAYNALRLKMQAPGKYDTSRIKDYDEIDERYKPYVYEAFLSSLVKGDSEGYFHPKDNLTRAEASTVLYRFLSRLDEGSFVTP
ncbi:MAG: S-layer homology domain-containing protein [Clostridia bacterium]|nr:S-layer homology domain-containing protein [Clostridia bacterium]